MIRVCSTVLFNAILTGLFLSGCSSPGGGLSEADKNLLTAETLIDAFYSFDTAQLAPLLVDAQSSAAALTFYQGWAEGGNYRVLRREGCMTEAATVISCAITVEDDPVLALNIDFNVTDTFKMTFEGTKLIAVENSSNDKPIYHEAFNWVVENMPEVMAGPCQGFFVDGPTPGDCARAMTAGYHAFASTPR